MQERIYTNYRLLLPTEEILGTIATYNGIITDIQPGIVSRGQDGEGNYLLPGLIELHTDNLEKCFSPRPGVRWNLDAAAVNHDRDLISSGITTVCDAISIGDVTPKEDFLRLHHYASMIDAVVKGQAAGRFSTNHLLHLRCELGYEHLYDIVEPYSQHSLLALISLMDHTPGQRQFVDTEKYKQYYIEKHGVPKSKMEEFISMRLESQRQHAEENRQALVKMSQEKAISLASHDDATINHIRQAIAEGVILAEFPTTIDAAKEAHNNGLQVLMGAPNIVLGGSHSGNVSAMELVKLDLVDIISSDYVPRSLLQSVFIVSQQANKPLHEAIKLVTLNSAKAINLDSEIGSLEVGKKADFITVHNDGVVPRILEVFKEGKRVA
ncbi:Alpha-D-ribose 1-methylphosphonate 5-triphosphate diphosphatase [Hyella patelloides LEGE 07179]|uniref:Alpha-D-ribose 1-methylphosphonate 5-triphosphate diphosphatase n=1 Tax=Hyella patelloides LEGE 07179 TaxID=945734 RepID=A0A563VQ11_9CYAN|nr:alpha-D-ribose 1-methylphosphonate 5-triphosphate diphosphatase [Hyella patelloides]VEP13484.1 Alpha-D-ribose 1-methylphosphonate 5-triphosphate diphosphatase [Hyella patelloides LEGE 07179]